jgi:hypothetical protein
LYLEFPETSWDFYLKSNGSLFYFSSLSLYEHGFRGNIWKSRFIGYLDNDLYNSSDLATPDLNIDNIVMYLSRKSIANCSLYHILESIEFDLRNSDTSKADISSNLYSILCNVSEISLEKFLIRNDTLKVDFHVLFEHTTLNQKLALSNARFTGIGLTLWNTTSEIGEIQLSIQLNSSLKEIFTSLSISNSLVKIISQQNFNGPLYLKPSNDSPILSLLYRMKNNSMTLFEKNNPLNAIKLRSFLDIEETDLLYSLQLAATKWHSPFTIQHV